MRAQRLERRISCRGQRPQVYQSVRGCGIHNVTSSTHRPSHEPPKATPDSNKTQALLYTVNAGTITLGDGARRTRLDCPARHSASEMAAPPGFPHKPFLFLPLCLELLTGSPCSSAELPQDTRRFTDGGPSIEEAQMLVMKETLMLVIEEARMLVIGEARMLVTPCVRVWTCLPRQNKLPHLLREDQD